MAAPRPDPSNYPICWSLHKGKGKKKWQGEETACDNMVTITSPELRGVHPDPLSYRRSAVSMDGENQYYVALDGPDESSWTRVPESRIV